MIFIHILIAVGSIVSATLALMTPTRRRLVISYILVALTFGSGTYLVVSLGASLLRMCESGLVYLGVVGILLVVAQYRRAALAANR